MILCFRFVCIGYRRSLKLWSRVVYRVAIVLYCEIWMEVVDKKFSSQSSKEAVPA